MNDKELLIRELIVKDFNEILVNEFCTDWKEKRLYIELLVRATHFDYLLNYIQEKDKEIERLKDLCNKYEEEHKTTYEIWKKDIYLYNSLVDRIDKAIEYIENKNKYLDRENYYQVFEYRDIYLIPLLDILKGVDKE